MASLQDLNRSGQFDGKAIILNLLNPTDVTLLDVEELFQPAALERLEAILMERVEANREKVDYHNNFHQNVGYYARSHGAITIYGARGSGKTTFLFNAFNIISKRHPELAILRLIDPTLVSTKEHVIVTIVQLIKEQVEAINSQDEPKLKKWWEQFRSLAGGLTQIDGIGPDKMYGDEWEDKSYVLEVGLEKAKAGSDLERHFNEFIKLSADLLNKQLFVLPFDDIDTQFERGWPVLETIRKYLTSPRIVPVVSGDIELYRTLVRRAQLSVVGTTILEFDRPNSRYHGDTNVRSWATDPLMQKIDALEDQYLLKILKPEFRIPILSLEQSSSKGGHRVEVIRSIKGLKGNDIATQVLTLDEYLSLFLKSGFEITSLSDSIVFKAAILRQPARSVWQLLKTSEKLLLGSISLNAFSGQIAQIFSSSLFKLGIEPTELNIASENCSMSVRALWKWAQESSLWEEAYRLTPDFLDERENHRALVFAAHFSALFDISPHIPIEYMVKAGWVRDLILQKQEDSNQIISYLGLDRNEKPSTVARRAIILQRMLDGNARKGVHRGTIHVPAQPKFSLASAAEHLYNWKPVGEGKTTHAKLANALNKTPFQALSSHEYVGSWWTTLGPYTDLKTQEMLGIVYNTLDSLTNRFSPLSTFIYMAASTTLESSRGERSTYLSAYALVGCISDLLGSKSDSVAETISWLAQKRVYPPPAWLTGGRATSTIEEDLSEDAEDDDYMEEHFSTGIDDLPLTRSIEIWHKAAKQSQPGSAIPPFFPARVMARFFFTLERIDGELGSKHYYAGNLLHRQLIALLNSILVEELRANGKLSTRVKLGNPTTSDQNFIDNWRYVEGLAPSAVPFFRMMFSCPLVGLFLAPLVDYRIGSKFEKWHWLEHQCNAWMTFCDQPDSEQFQYRDSLRVEGSVRGKQLAFPNLWALLNTVPVLAARSHARPQVIQRFRKQRNPGSNSSTTNEE